ncbi:hypothetical protein [Alkaliphilus sp. B6464]
MDSLLDSLDEKGLTI